MEIGKYILTGSRENIVRGYERLKRGGEMVRGVIETFAGGGNETTTDRDPYVVTGYRD